MATPHYVAKKVGDRFELVRQDADAKKNDAVLIAGGADESGDFEFGVLKE